jgi:hypothetical protein
VEQPSRIPSSEPPPVDDFLHRLEVRRRRLRLVLAVVLALGAAGAVASVVLLRTLAGDGEGKTRSPDADGKPYAFAHPDDPAALRNIDMATVHGVLFPEWIVACAHALSHERWERAQQAFAALRAAVQDDANLAGILDELQSLVGKDPWRGARQILRLYEAWSDYLARNGIPYEVRAVVHEGGEGPPWVSARFYRTVAAFTVQVDARAVDARLVRRVDSLNLRELYLGEAREEGRGARILVDRVSDFALSELWPLLCAPPAGAEDPRTDEQGSFAPFVTAEIEAALPVDTVAVLRGAACARAELQRVARQIEGRAACGSHYGINYVPWNGFGPDTVASLRERAAATGDSPCPDVTVDEAGDAARYSQELAFVPQLRLQLERLVAWAARSTAIHEARHVADDLDERAGKPLRCPDCGRLPASSLAELSAYLASFADPATGHAALYQACSLRASATTGPFAPALDAVLPCLLPGGCRGVIPNEVPVRAAPLQQELLGRADAITLGGEFPSSVPATR